MAGVAATRIYQRSPHHPTRCRHRTAARWRGPPSARWRTYGSPASTDLPRPWLSGSVTLVPTCCRRVEPTRIVAWRLLGATARADSARRWLLYRAATLPLYCGSSNTHRLHPLFAPAPYHCSYPLLAFAATARCAARSTRPALLYSCRSGRFIACVYCPSPITAACADVAAPSVWTPALAVLQCLQVV